MIAVTIVVGVGCQ